MEEMAKPPASGASSAPAQAASPADPKTSGVDAKGHAQIAKDMHVKVYSPFHTYYDDRAISFSGVNDTGPFDILPGHRNFMSLLSPCELVIRAEKGESKIKIARAVMHVKANDIIVFLDV